MRTADKIKSRYKRYLERSGKVERALVSADGGLSDPWREITVSVSVEQRQDNDPYVRSDEERITVFVFRDQSDPDVGGIRKLTRDYQLIRDATFDADTTPYHFDGAVREQGRDYMVAEFTRTRAAYVGRAAS